MPPPASPTPPPPPERRPSVSLVHGEQRVDPWAWLRDREDPAVRAHLVAENAYAEASLEHLEPLRERLFREYRVRVVETDQSVPVRHGPWWYFSRTAEGSAYPVHCRVPVGPAGGEEDPPAPGPDPLAGEEVLLDENAAAVGHDFLSVGTLDMSPDHAWMAYGVDTTGDERFTLRFRQAGTTTDSPEAIVGASYGGAWANAATFLYTTVDEALRPHRVWRHRLGQPHEADELVLEEPDQRFHVSVGRTTDDRFVVVDLRSAITAEVWLLPTDDPHGPLACVAPRRHGVDYTVEHLPGWVVAVTNDGAEDFEVLAAPDDPLPVTDWRPVLGHRPGTRVEDVLALSGHLVVAERAGGEPGLRILQVAEGGSWPFGADPLASSWVVDSGEHPATTRLGPNPEYRAASLRVEQTSLVTPRTVVDLTWADGRHHVRKRQPVGGGFDPADYRTARLWAPAPDGREVPISIVRAASTSLPAPCLLYGYGAYEHSIDPAFSALRLSLLDRGAVFAIGHVRGGGELGRRWYEEGKLAQKPTTFSDFVACGRHLVELGVADGDRLVARGGSAGGLLMGAAANLDPALFRAVVAEVPFVDALNTVLDETLPLTVIEWEEWGNPVADAEIYRVMRGYAPYENVAATGADGHSLRYPDVLATAGLEDSRVGYWEPAKWVARLREANPENRALLRTELSAGHGGPTDRYRAWAEEAVVQAFVLDALGLAERPGRLAPAAP